MEFKDICRILQEDESIDWFLVGPRHYLRGLKKGVAQEFCPITAACYLETGNLLRTGLVEEAAQELGLPMSTKIPLLPTLAWDGEKIRRLADNKSHRRSYKTKWDDLYNACGRPSNLDLISLAEWHDFCTKYGIDPDMIVVEDTNGEG